MRAQATNVERWEYDPETLCVIGDDDREVCDIGFHMDATKSAEAEEARAHHKGLLIAQAPTLKAENEALRAAASEMQEVIADAMASHRGYGSLESPVTIETVSRRFGSAFAPILNPATQEESK